MKLLTSVLFFSALVQSSWTACVTCVYGGTFCDDPPYSGVLPTCPEEINELQVEMFTRPNTDTGIPVDPDTVPSNFDPTRRTYFVAHGYLNDFSTPWLQDQKDAFLTREDANVVVVGWGGVDGSESVNYFESAATTRTVGAYVGMIVLNLINSGGGDASLMWCSGHSLGAHVAGYAGKWTQTEGGITIARITGQDPAGPDFSDNDSPLVGLYRTDAVFVDTINTDGVYGSFPEGTGQLNFFPNAETDAGRNQPGCVESICDHNRAHELMTGSMTVTSCFTATQVCDNPLDEYSFNNIDQCAPCTTCPQMGYDAAPSDGKVYWLATTADAPYCNS